MSHTLGRVRRCPLRETLLAQTGATEDDSIRVARGSVTGRGQGRLDDPEDLVRTEIAAALERKIPVIPVLVRDASMPHKNALPQNLRTLARRDALEVSHQRWRYDVERLIEAIQGFLPQTTPRL